LISREVLKIFQLRQIFIIILSLGILFLFPKTTLNGQGYGVDHYFSSYEVLDAPLQHLHPQLLLKSNQNAAIMMDLGEYGEFEVILEETQIVADDYKLRMLTENGEVTRGKPATKTYRGTLKNDHFSLVTLTIAEGFMYGFIRTHDDEIYYEPLYHYNKSAKKGAIIVYNRKSRKDTRPLSCQHFGDKSLGHDHHHHGEKNLKSGACFTFKLAVASDFLMYDFYNSVENVENHAIAVLNDSQTNYDDEFADQFNFQMTEHVISTCRSCDPWPSTVDMDDLLLAFAFWSKDGFTREHAQSSFWTKRDLENDNNVGLAYIGSLCSDFSAAILEDFTDGPRKRVLWTHELGHNFGATHDVSGSEFIMSPKLVETNAWSNKSLQAIESFYPQVSCLTECNEAPEDTLANFTFDILNECAPSMVQFTASNAESLDSVKWVFENGTPETSTDFNPDVIFNSKGQFGVRLTVYAGDVVDEEVKNRLISVNGAPNASFEFVEVNRRVSFTNRSSGAETYLWDFGDGNTSGFQNPIHTYEEGGTYFVNLTVTNTCGEDRSLKSVVMEGDQPISNFEASNDSICTSGFISFLNLSSFADSYEWEFEGGDPATSTEANPTVIYNDPGSFNVTLTVQNNFGTDVKTFENYINVNTSPETDFSEIIDGNTVQFENGSEHADSYLWDFGDGQTSDEINPIHTYATSGSFEVTLTSYNECGSEILSKNITIENNEPIASFTANRTSICSGSTISYSNTSSNGESYLWQFDGGKPSFSTAENPTVRYTDKGTFNVSLKVTNGNGEDTFEAPDFVIVSAEPLVDFEISISEHEVTIENNSMDADSYVWEFGDGTTSTDENPIHTYTEDGNYTVTLLASNECGTESLSKSISINTETDPIIPAFETSSRSICPGEVVLFTNLSENATEYIWEFEGGNPAQSTDENPIVQYNNSGSFQVSLTAKNGDLSETITFTEHITVHVMARADFEFSVEDLTVVFQNNSVGSKSYVWNFGDGNQSNETNPKHTYAEPGSYNVRLTALGECGFNNHVENIELNIFKIAFSATERKGCRPLEVQYFNESTGDISEILWTFEGGTPATSTEMNPIVQYGEAGNFSSKLTVKHNGEFQSLLYPEYMSISNPIAFDIDFEVEGRQITFINQSQHYDRISWNFGDGSISKEEQPVHVYDENGVYTVSITLANACEEILREFNVQLSDQPEVSFTSITLDECFPNEIQFFNTTNYDYDSLNWNFEGGLPLISSEENPVVRFESEGEIEVKLFVYDNENLASKIDTINLAPPSFGQFTVSESAGIFEFTLTDQMIDSVFWDFGDGSTSDTLSPIHEFDNQGEYLVSVQVYNSCGIFSSSQMVAFNEEELKAGFTSDISSGCSTLEVQFMDQSTGSIDQYTWTFKGGIPEQSNERNPLVRYENAGSFDVKLTVKSGDTFNSFLFTNYITVNDCDQGAKEDDSLVKNRSNEHEEINVFPNPFADQINLEIPSKANLENISVSLFDILGNQVLSSFNRQEDVLVISTQHLLAGQYFLRVKYGDKLSASKIIKL